jgi:hypothetical protein
MNSIIKKQLELKKRRYENNLNKLSEDFAPWVKYINEKNEEYQQIQDQIDKAPATFFENKKLKILREKLRSIECCYTNYNWHSRKFREEENIINKRIYEIEKYLSHIEMLENNIKKIKKINDTSRLLAMQAALVNYETEIIIKEKLDIKNHKEGL